MIYFLSSTQGTGAIKIGYTADESTLARRISALQTGQQDRLYLLGTSEGDREDEATIHRVFNRYRLNGEWFSRATPILHFIDSLPRYGLEVAIANSKHNMIPAPRNKKHPPEEAMAEAPAEEKRAFSIIEFAKRWGIGRNSVYNAIARGELGSVKIGRRRVITLEQEEAFRQLMESKSA